jgi:hypothetical protein
MPTDYRRVADYFCRRESTTLVDDSLLAGAFLCDVTWALAGWQWLIPPAILFVGYAVLPANRRGVSAFTAAPRSWPSGSVPWGG